MGGAVRAAKRLIVASMIAMVAGPVQAQRTAKSVLKDLEYGVRDILYVWASPLHADSDEWATFAASAGLVGATLVIDDDVDSAMLRHPNSAFMKALDPFRESSDGGVFNLGSGKALQPLAGLLYVVGFAFDSRALRDAGLGCASTQQASILVHHAAYTVIARERPSTANGNQYLIELGGGDWEQHSFYGGHAGNIMGCVTYWNERFHLGAAEPVLYALAVGVGLGRVADQRHWLSDTVTGMLIGHAFGRVIAHRARARAAPPREEMVAPDQGGSFYLDMGRSSGKQTLVVGWRREF